MGAGDADEEEDDEAADELDSTAGFAAALGPAVARALDSAAADSSLETFTESGACICG
jgi:hypothetical protein